MSLNRRYDIAVVGGGVIGLSCALHLLHAGRSVLVLDQARAGSGASFGNCGTITPSHALPLAQPGMVRKALRWMLSRDAPFYVRPRLDPSLLSWMLRFAGHCNWDQVKRATRDRAALLNLSRQLLEELIRRESIDCEFETSGLLTVFRDERSFAESGHIEGLLKDVAVPMEVWSADQVLRAEPALKEGVVAGHWFPTDAVLRPDRFVDALARCVRAAGGEIVEGQSVEGLRASASTVSVVVQGQMIAANDVVVAGGAWSATLLKSLGIRIPMQPGKGYSITYGPNADAPKIPLVLREPSVCVTSWGSGFRLGSTMEFSGYDASLNRLRLDALVRGARQFLHTPIDVQGGQEWCGWRPMMPDDLPLIGRSSRETNLWYATGHGMLGMSMSVATGHGLSAMIQGQSPAIDMSAFAPARIGV